MKYLHFSSNWKSNSVKKDRIFNTNWESSLYWQSRLEGEQIKAKEEEIKRQQYNLMNDNLSNIKIKGKEAKELIIEEIMPILKDYKYSTELLKEYIFEEIRQKEFSGCPSRKKCMFCFDKNIDYKKYANQLGFDLNNYNLFEIEILEEKSTVHTGNMDLLNCNSQKYNEIATQARTYWKGYERNNLNSEIIFEGCFKVTDVIIENF